MRLPPVPGRINLEVDYVGVHEDVGTVQAGIYRHGSRLFAKGRVADLVKLVPTTAFEEFRRWKR